MYDRTLYRELDALPTQATGQADDLKLDSRQLGTGIDFDHDADAVLIWTDRTEPGRIHAERYIGGRYVDDNDVLAVVAAARFDGVL